MRTRTEVAALIAVAMVATACGSEEAVPGDTVAAVETTTSAPATTTPATEPPPQATEAPTTEAPTTPAPTTPAPTTPAVTTATSPPVVTFPDAASIAGWSVVNDTVMGGVSTGQLEWSDARLVFTGELSLDNNGGFASVRSPFIDPATTDWRQSAGPRIVAQGDGRTWTVEVRTDEMDGGWIAELATSPGEPTDVELPWASFEPVTRFLDPREPAGPLDPARIVSIAFYLVDGVESPFRLELVSIS